MTGRPLLALLLVLAVAACTPTPGAGAGDGETSTGPAVPQADALVSTRVGLPAGALPELAVPWDGALLVGVVREDQEPRPALLRVTGERSAEVPLVAATGYGRSASWVALAVDGERILGVGADRGGAHGNPRWSVWTGDADGVQEREQAFSTFGGWGAGELVDAVARPDGDALVGSWQGDVAGLDVAVWTRSGEEWTRSPSTGTSLQGTRASVVAALAVAGAPDGLIITGWVYGTAPGGTQAPVVWRAPEPGGPWTREALPAAGGRGSAMAVRCTDGGADGTCVVAGQVDGNLALWRSVAEGGWIRVPGLPSLPVDESVRLPAPLLRPDGVDQVVTDEGRPAVLSVAWDGQPARLRPVDGPQAAPVAAAAVDGRLYLVTGTVPGTGTVTGTEPSGGSGGESGGEPGAQPGAEPGAQPGTGPGGAAAAAPTAELWSAPW
ncbi:hypothetical protein [Pseudonocardia sp.]|uniref:hypothetical protein n=1 Tax=Pseudonocardia sp. TaxID=60912 RepID=UPI003D0EDC23